MNIFNCGDESHDVDCLHDVHISTPAPIRYGLTQVANGARAAAALGMSAPYTSSDAAALGEALLRAWDATRHVSTCSTHVENLKDRRADVLSFLREGHSILDVPELLSDEDLFTFGDILQAITNNQVHACWTWDDLQWIKAEALLQGHPTARELQDALGCTRFEAQSLGDWYGVDLTVVAQGLAPQDALIVRNLVSAHPTLPPRQLVLMAGDLGVTTSAASISDVRLRLNKKALRSA